MQSNMESKALGMETSTAPDPRVDSDRNLAYLRRRAWAHSKDSIWQEPEPEHSSPQGPQGDQKDGEAQRPSEEAGRDPNKITNWLIECRTPLGASLDDQSASPSRGALRNGCSFEDDLSLGAEANHLQSANNKTESCFGLVADQKRSRFKEGRRSMNSTGSGKSSTVSSVSELLDLYEEDPEEILLNLGFGREEPDPASRVPSRFINNASSARGIDIKVYLGAQLQRMELENPNYALTSRFRQIEVLTTVANEFFQLYSQVSGQPVQRISRDQEGDGGEEGKNEPPPLKRNSSALNVAKLLKKTISKHNLHAANSESSEGRISNHHTGLNGHVSTFSHENTNGDTHASTEQDSLNSDHQAESVNQKHNRKKDSCSLATVTEETNGDGETEESPEPSDTGPATNGKHEPESGDLQSTVHREDKVIQDVKEVEEGTNLTSTPEKAPCTLAPLQLSQLRNKNTDSFDMEEIHEDETLPHKTSRTTDLSRTASQQSDSSGFAEETSVDSNSYLKVQESSDSCDSETTVTSHPSQDVATPLAVDQPKFVLPDGTQKESEPDGAAEAQEKSSSMEQDEHDHDSEQVPQYISHQLHINRPVEMPDEEQDKEQVESGDRTNAAPVAEISQSAPVAQQETQLGKENVENLPASKEDPQNSQNQTESTRDTEPRTEEVDAVDGTQEEQAFVADPDSLNYPVCSSPVLNALQRAKQNQLSREGHWISPKSGNAPQIPGRGRARGRGSIPLQRSSSLPSSLLSPSRVVSSVRIQFGRGQASCTKPRFSFRYTQEDGGEKEEEKEREKEEQTSCLPTVIIKPASSGSNNQPSLPTEAPVQPKPNPRYPMRSSQSLQSSSPPPDWSLGGPPQVWNTQSYPDLTSPQQQLGQFQLNMNNNHNQPLSNPGQAFSNPNPNPYPNPSASYFNPSPSPRPTHSPFPISTNPPLHYPSPGHFHASLPNLFSYNNSCLSHHSSLTSLYHPMAPSFPLHNSLSNLHQPSVPTAPHHASLGNLNPGTPLMHFPGYNHLHGHQSPYHSSPYGSHSPSPYLGFQGYNMNPNLAFPHPVPPYPPTQPMAPEHNLHHGLAPSGPGFYPGMATNFSPASSLHLGHSPPALSSTEMQLRKVLHDIRGTVQSLNQNQGDTLDTFIEHKSSLPSHRSLGEEFQQKRRSLNLFRGQMLDLELSIIQQQASVYKHLSPAERLELEQLQSLRSAVREELQELEQQLEDRLVELTHQTKYGGLHRESSIDSLSTASALRAIEPVSDLLREQLVLRSEITDDSPVPPSRRSSQSSISVRGEEGEQRGGTYRASINITPATPQRPNTHTEQEEEKKEEGESDGEQAVNEPEVEGAVGGVKVDNLQQLIKQIRESVAQEVRQEIYGELLASVSQRQPLLPPRQQPL